MADTAAVHSLLARIRSWSLELGFSGIGVAALALAEDERHLLRWLELGRHGEMRYMARWGTRRAQPARIVPGTLSVIAVRMDYWPGEARNAEAALADSLTGYVSRYALGRDYHRVLRSRLKRLAERLQQAIGPFGYRAFVDSGPILEKALARNAGLGWIGKHTNLIARDAGSYFFLGALLTDLPLPVGRAPSNHCGSCRACLDVCPTRAIVAPYELDARRCISYLTIELHGTIPLEFRAAIGNRIFGCDDCQLVCPWNKYARMAADSDFRVRHGLDSRALVDLFEWSEQEYLARTEGSALRRLGHERWLRNIAVALGNASTCPQVIAALHARSRHSSVIVREHVAWALERHGQTAEQ